MSAIYIAIFNNKASGVGINTTANIQLHVNSAESPKRPQAQLQYQL